jgi:hypothetical protein
MTKKIRFIILLICVACFFVVLPILVLYSIGDRFDFAKMKIISTGGIYVRTFPTAEQIIIDSKIIQKPGLFSNSIFVQSLQPKNHTVLAKKDGYYDYFKTIPVQEKQVTKLENILLFKKNIQFVEANETQSPFTNQGKFIIKNSNLYYSNIPGNSGLTAAQKATPVLKKIVSFALQNNNIIWLGSDGFLYKSDPTGPATITTKVTLTAIKINKISSYKIIPNNNDIFVITDNELLLLNGKTGTLDKFYQPVNNARISPDGKNIAYYDNNNIYISPVGAAPSIKNTLYNSSEKIGDCLWMNDDYIVFTVGDKIILSEIDYRGNINAVTLPQDISISGDPAIMVTVKNPNIYFSRQEGKLYISTDSFLLVSEKITP